MYKTELRETPLIRERNIFNRCVQSVVNALLQENERVSDGPGAKLRIERASIEGILLIEHLQHDVSSLFRRLSLQSLQVLLALWQEETVGLPEIFMRNADLVC